MFQSAAAQLLPVAADLSLVAAGLSVGKLLSVVAVSAAGQWGEQQ